MTAQRLGGKVALVTGAPRSIGRAIAEAMAGQGASVAVHYRSRREEALGAVEEMTSRGFDVLAVAADLTDGGAVVRMFEEVTGHFGGIDIVVANAGTTAPRASVAETTDEVFDRLLAVNTRATFAVLRQAARQIRDHGRIINVSSSSTWNPQPGIAAYATSKSGALTTIRVLAQELGARGITANSVVSGPVAAGFLDAEGDTARRLGEDTLARLAAAAPAGRLGTPADIASVAAFLAGEDAAWVNGQTIRVNGGGSL